MVDKRELNYAIESNRIFHEFTMDSILNKIIDSGNSQVARVDKMQLDYHLNMVGSAYNSFKRLTVDKSMLDRVSRAIISSESTFSMVTKIPDENEITAIRPRAIIGYINMIDKALNDITKGKVDDKKEKKLTSYDKIMEDLGPDLFDGDMVLFRDNCHYNVDAIARVNNARVKSINADTINYTIIPWIYNFNDTSNDISGLVKDYRITIDYIKNNVPRILNTAASLRQQGIQNNLKDNRYAQFSIKATKNLLNIISFLTIITMRKINTTTELMNKYTEICKCFLEYKSKETPIIKEDCSAENEYIPATSWYKCINGDIGDITKSCEDIINYYSQYNDLSKGELLILNDLDKSNVVVNPYNLDKSLNYATYDTEPYNIKEAFYAIESGLSNLEQNMSDEFKFANKIISESGLTLDMVDQYRERLEPITSMTRYSTPEATYSRSVPFMICKELMSMPDNLKIITELANNCYNHAVAICNRVIDNEGKEIKDPFVQESLRTFTGNFVESYKTFAESVYDAFTDRVNALSRHLNGLHLPNRVDETAYFGVEESYDDLNSDLNLISFEDTLDIQSNEYRLEENKAARMIIERYMSDVRGDVFTEGDENGSTSSSSSTEQQSSGEQTKSESQPQQTSDANQNQETRKEGESTDGTEKPKENESNSDGKTEDKDKSDTNGSSDKTDDKENFFKKIMERIKKALLNYLNKMRDKLDAEFTSKEFTSKLNAVMNEDAIKYLNDLTVGKYSIHILKTAVQGYVGPMFGSAKRSVNGKSHEELQTAVKNFDVNFKNIDASVIVNATEENYRKVILEQFFHKTLSMSNVTIPDNIRSESAMSEITDFIRERIYETWSYGGFSKEEGGSDNEIGRGTETGEPKRKFVLEEVIKYLKYCQANGSETPAGWLPEHTTLENTLDKIEKSFGDAYKKSEDNNENSDNNSEKSEEEKKAAEDQKKKNELIRKKLEFCGTCFNTAVQAFKDCIISRARDYINVLNRLVPDDIRSKHGGKPEGVNKDNEEEKTENEDNNSEENNSNNENNNENANNSEGSSNSENK